MSKQKVISREASELGWAPGFVPYITSVDGIAFEFVQNIERNDEVIGWSYISHYSQPEVITLKVWND
jgi:hypothetical protein